MHRIGRLVRVTVIPALVAAAGSSSFARQTCDWTHLTDRGPTARNQHFIAWDGIRIVTLGGYDGAVLGDTWLWGGSSWSRGPVSGPSPRIGHAMAYAGNNSSLVFGGFNGEGLSDSWLWHGDTETWELLEVSGPEARDNHAMAYDALRDEVVVFGGYSATRTEFLDDTWVWRGGDWIHLRDDGPDPRYTHAMVFDEARGVVVLFGGGVGGGDNHVFGDTWTWNGGSWLHVSDSGPAPRQGHSMVYDPVRRTVVLFGGYDGSQIFSDTWEWNGSGWVERPVSGPPARFRGGMLAYDTPNERILVFGGGTDGTLFGDTWALRSKSVADLASPFGMLNVFDFLAFQNYFSGGCP